MFRYLFLVFGVLTFGDCQECRDDYTLIDGECFKAYYYYNTSWKYAQEICELDGAQLAVISSCSMFGKLARFFHISGFESTAGYWIAASDINEEGTWLWADGTTVPLDVPFWGTTGEEFEPNGDINENCAQLSPTDQYYFHDENCEKDGNPLCQIIPIHLDE